MNDKELSEKLQELDCRREDRETNFMMMNDKELSEKLQELDCRREDRETKFTAELEDMNKDIEIIRQNFILGNLYLDDELQEIRENLKGKL